MRVGLSALLLSVSVLSLFFLLVVVDGCGVTTHNEVTQRALTFWNPSQSKYLEVLKKHQAAFQAGSAFPDFGYPNLKKFGGSFGSTSEFTHWQYFQGMVAEYVHQNFKQPWDEEAERLIALVFGTTGHASADTVWHGMYGNCRDGFIPAQGMIDFRVQNTPGSCCFDSLGCFGHSHSMADEGGDLALSYSYGIPWFRFEWDIPIQSLLKIYAQCEARWPQLFHHTLDNGTVVEEHVTEGAIIERGALLFAEIVAMHGIDGQINAGKLLYSKYSNPFLTERYEDWILAGVDDSAAWVSWEWDLLVNITENGYNSTMSGGSTKGTNEIHSHGGPSGSIHSLFSSLYSGYRNLEKTHFGFNVQTKYGHLVPVQVVHKGNSVFLSLPEDYKQSLEDQFKKSTNQKQGKKTNHKVHVISENSQEQEELPLSSVSASASAVLSVSTPYSHAGTSLATGDLNSDGIPDLVIGAPGFSQSGKQQIGAVFVKFGSKNKLEGNIDLASSADLKFFGSSLYSRFGQSVAVLDLNLDGILDLVVAAPAVGSQSESKATNFIPRQDKSDTYNVYGSRFRGTVQIFFGNKGLKSGVPDVVISTQNEFSRLGWHLKTGDVDGDGQLDLLIGSPFSNEVGVLRGRASIFLSKKSRFTSGSNIDIDKADWTMIGEFDGDWLGYHMEVVQVADKRYVLIGAPTKGKPLPNNGVLNSVGKVYGFVVSSSSPSLNLTKYFTLTGVHEHDKTGQMFSVGSPTTDKSKVLFAVSSPTKNHTNEIVQAGEVALISFADLHGDLSLDELKPELVLIGGVHRARLGWKSGFEDLNGDGVDDFWLTEPLRESGLLELGQEAGGAYAWYGGANFPSGVIPKADEKSSIKIENNVPRSRLGINALWSDLNADGKLDALLVTKDSPYQRLAGSVNVYYF